MARIYLDPTIKERVISVLRETIEQDRELLEWENNKTFLGMRNRFFFWMEEALESKGYRRRTMISLNSFNRFVVRTKQITKIMMLVEEKEIGLPPFGYNGLVGTVFPFCEVDKEKKIEKAYKTYMETGEGIDKLDLGIPYRILGRSNTVLGKYIWDNYEGEFIFLGTKSADIIEGKFCLPLRNNIEGPNYFNRFYPEEFFSELDLTNIKIGPVNRKNAVSFNLVYDKYIKPTLSSNTGNIGNPPKTDPFGLPIG
jgi:hypothetical protein